MDDDRVILENLPTSVRGLVFMDDNGDPVIIVNARLTREANQHTFLHEKEHIKHGDMDNPDFHEYKEGTK